MDNQSIDEQRIMGLPKGLELKQFERTDELNLRLLERNEPQYPLAPNFTPRPVLTKYSLFPILDARMPCNVDIEANYNYSLETNFTPPVGKNAPVSGFINNVNLESDLLNIHHALQKGAGQNVYVPPSNSDMYRVTVPSRPSEQPFPGLFEPSSFSKSAHPNIESSPHVGNMTFHNNTRTQLRGGPQ